MATGRIAAIYFDVFAKTSQLQVAQNQILQFGQTTKTTGVGVGSLSAAVVQLGTQSAAAATNMASGAQRANATIQQASQGVTQVQRKFGTASFAIASTLEGVARTGTTSAEAMKGLLKQGANAAFFFGSTGAFVGALAAATLAIVALFRRPREELEALERRNQEFVRQLRESRDLPSAAREARRLFSGDPNARQVDEEGKPIPGAVSEVLGVARLRALVAAAKAQVAETQKQLALDKDLGQSAAEKLDRIQKLILLEQVQTENLNNQLTALYAIEKRYIEALALTKELTAEAVRRTTTEFANKAQEEAARKAIEALEKQKDLTSDLSDATREFDRHMQGLQGNIDKALSDAAVARARELQEIMAELTATATDDLALGFAKVQQSLADMQAPQAFIDQVKALHAVIVASKKDAEDLDKLLADLASSGVPAFQQLTVLDQRRNELASERDAITKTDEASLQRRAALEALLQKIEDERLRIAKEFGKQTEETTTAVADLAGVMADTVNAAFGIASGLLGAEHAATRLLGSVGQIFGGLSKISQLASTAGGLGKLLGTGSGIASALGPIGAIVGGGFALASLVRESPEEKERRRLLEENNRRLANLRDGLVEAVALTISGRSAAAIAGVRTGTEFVSGRNELTGEDIISIEPRRVSEIVAELRRAGVSLEDLRKAAADLGIELKGTIPTFEEFRQIQEGIRLSGFDRLFGTLAGQLKFLDLQARAIGLRDEDVLLRKAKILSDAVPLFADALEGIDIRTAEGRAEAIRRLIQTLEGLKSLTPEQLGLLGDLPIGEFADQLVEFIEALRRLEPEVAEIADATAQAADTAADAAERAAARAAALTRTRQRLAITDLEDDAQAVLEALLAAWTQQIPSLGPLLRQFAGATLDETIRKIFDAVTSGVIAIEELGVPLDEFLAALLEIESASDAAAAALQSVAGVLQAFEQIDIETRLLGGERLGNDTLRRKLGVLFPSTGGLSDLTTLQGISDTIALIRHAISVEKDADRKKALESFLGDLLDAFDAMRTGGSAGAGAGAGATPGGGDVSRSGVTQITERSAFLMIDLDRTRNVILRNIEDLLRAGAGALRPVSLGGLTPPTTSLGGSAVSVAQSGGTVIHVNQHFTINVGAGADAEAIGAAVALQSRRALENIDQGLFQNVQGRRRTAGISDLT